MIAVTPDMQGKEHRAVLNFTQVIGIGTPRTPHPQASAPPPWFWGGGAHSLAREGLGESQFRRGGIYTVVLFTVYLCT
jgi:hypothetical protein